MQPIYPPANNSVVFEAKRLKKESAKGLCSGKGSKVVRKGKRIPMLWSLTGLGGSAEHAHRTPPSHDTHLQADVLHDFNRNMKKMTSLL
ncbi:hypothetical protein NPIL_493951 [Nephila pilipes]|uniref:Uncharacterized protein n=1 Tax=Nephila pilipes TaxID=299642 RepID=A0A8X6UF83_NEPPI|nr:hypothetical protein NPIL_493951 [Nephila pilipes]